MSMKTLRRHTTLVAFIRANHRRYAIFTGTRLTLVSSNGGALWCHGRAECALLCQRRGGSTLLVPAFAQKRFNDFPLDDRLLRGVDAAIGGSEDASVDGCDFGSAQLTKVQAIALPALLEDHKPDVLFQAHTGTGKTLAFLIPIVQKLLDRFGDDVEVNHGVVVLLVAPTRELVLQLAHVAQKLLMHCGGVVRSSFVAGGFSMNEDVQRLQSDCPQILVATPGRLAQHLQGTPNFVKALQSVEILVLDEADRLLDAKLVHQVDYLIRCLPFEPRPQTMLCSATFAESVQRFACRVLRANLLSLAPAASNSLETTDKSTGRNSSTYGGGEVVDRVEQTLIRYLPSDFLNVLFRVLNAELQGTDGAVGKSRRVLVLFPTVRWLQFIYVLLKHRVGMRNVWALHAQIPDEVRRARTALFARGAPQVNGCLFATDLAARGLDFDVDCVVQVGPPPDREQYVHRTGRTGRLNATGRSILLVNSLEEECVLTELQGVGLRDHHEAFGGNSCRHAVVNGDMDGATTASAIRSNPTSSQAELAPPNLHGWWEEPSLVASGDLFFASAVGFYFERRRTLRATTEQIVRLTVDLLASTGLPKERRFPPLPPGLAKRLLAEDPMCGVRAATVRQRWDLLSALPAYPGFRSRAAAAAGQCQDTHPTDQIEELP